jgi:hypothetical protein
MDGPYRDPIPLENNTRGLRVQRIFLLLGPRYLRRNTEHSLCEKDLPDESALRFHYGIVKSLRGHRIVCGIRLKSPFPFGYGLRPIPIKSKDVTYLNPVELEEDMILIMGILLVVPSEVHDFVATTLRRASWAFDRVQK